MKSLRWVFVVAALLFFAARPSRAQNVTAQSVQTQKLTLSPASPITVTGLQATPSVQGSASYWYWVVAHVGSDVSVPQGPAVITNGPASLGGFAVNTVSWNPVSGASSYDVLRTATSTPPVLTCNCAVIIGAAQFSATDSSNSLLSYTVNTSNDQVSVVCTNLGGCGASGATGTAFNPTAIYVAPNCGTTPNCFTVFWNTRFDQTCSISNTSTSVTCSDAPFTNADVGKKIAGFNTCNTDMPPTNATLIGTSATTISAVVSSSQITLSLAATGTQATTACIVYGNPDDSGLAAAEALAATFTSCPTMILPAGIGMITTPAFGHTSPASCTATGAIGGGTDAPIGYQIQGQGIVSSLVFLPPDFAWASCTFGHDGHACFGYKQLYFRAWGLTGGGLNTISSPPATLDIIESDFVGSKSGVTDFSCMNLIAGDTTGNGVGYLASGAQNRSSSFDGCEGSAFVTNSRTKSSNTAYQDSRKLQVQVGSGAVFESVNDRFYPGGVSNNFAPGIDMNGGIAHLVNAQIGTNFVNQQVRGITFDATSTLNLVNSRIEFNNGSTLNSGIFVSSGTATVTAVNSFIAGTNTNGSFAGGATNYFDQGGNTILSPITASPFSVFGSASITGVLQTVGNIALTSGWSTSSVGTVSGTSQQSRWTVTAAGTPAASPVITVTFPTAFLAAPLCQFQQQGGNFGDISNPAITITATAATLTFSGTPVAAHTYVMDLECANP